MRNSLINKYLLITLLLNFTLFFSLIAQSTLKKGKNIIYKFSIKEEIAPPIARMVSKAIDEAQNIKADYIYIEMNTYGGAVDAADSIRTKILNSKIPTLILIQNNAASAGALIALACDSIYMQPGSTIGAATVVDQSGNQVPDKYQSYMRKKMRATAEQNGRNPDIAEAMVDPDIYIPGIIDSGKVITFTTSEAIKYKFCEAELNSLKDILKRIGISDYQIIEQKITFMDEIISWLISPFISGLLIMIIIGGIYFELQTPGIGFPILAAITAAILYFAPLYLEGLAENWEILLFVIGVLLIGAEIFVIPGFGIAGISGIILIITGLTLSMVENIGFDFTITDNDQLLKALLTVIIASIISLVSSIYLGVKFIESSTFKKFVLQSAENNQPGYNLLNEKEKSLVGKTGITTTLLRPSGKIEIEGEIYDSTAEIGFIEKGEKVIVKKFEASQLFVSKINN